MLNEVEFYYFLFINAFVTIICICLAAAFESIMILQSVLIFGYIIYHKQKKTYLLMEEINIKLDKIMEQSEQI